MERDPTLMADILAEFAPGEPSADDLVGYARDPGDLAPANRERVERYLAAAPENRERFRAIAPDDWTLTGSCLCGTLSYSVRGPLPAIGHCHCIRCRKAHGAAFGSFALIRASTFRWRQGEGELTRYGGDDDSVTSFCSRCGTTLTGNASAGLIALAVATLDVDPVARPRVHAWVGERASWFEIADDVAQYLGPVPDVVHEERT